MSPWRRLAASLATILLLGGCTQLASNAIQDFGDLRQATRDYISERFAYRRDIRRRCWDILMAEVFRLQASGRNADARQVLGAAYPKLTLVELTEDGDLSQALQSLNDAQPCLVSRVPLAPLS